MVFSGGHTVNAVSWQIVCIAVKLATSPMGSALMSRSVRIALAIGLSRAAGFVVFRAHSASVHSMTCMQFARLLLLHKWIGQGRSCAWAPA